MELLKPDHADRDGISSDLTQTQKFWDMRIIDYSTFSSSAQLTKVVPKARFMGLY